MLSRFFLESVEQSQTMVCQAIRHAVHGKSICSYSNTIKVKGKGREKKKKRVLPALRMQSKYKTSAWIIAGRVLFCMVWGWGREEGKSHPADILQPACKQHELKAINM